MKISKIPTDYLFIKSIDSNEFSDFAIIHGKDGQIDHLISE